MKYKHTVVFRSGQEEVYEFNTKQKSDMAIKNAQLINKTFHTMDRIYVEPVSQPEKREEIVL